MVRREGEALVKAEELQNFIERATSQMEELKQREGGAYEREDEREEKLKFLASELDTKQKDADDKERQEASLRRDKDKILEEIDDVQRNIEEVHEEMEKLHELTDDI